MLNIVVLPSIFVETLIPFFPGIFKEKNSIDLNIKNKRPSLLSPLINCIGPLFKINS